MHGLGPEILGDKVGYPPPAKNTNSHYMLQKVVLDGRIKLYILSINISLHLLVLCRHDIQKSELYLNVYGGDTIKNTVKSMENAYFWSFLE